jgi:hypothetical protein
MEKPGSILEPILVPNRALRETGAGTFCNTADRDPPVRIIVTPDEASTIFYHVMFGEIHRFTIRTSPPHVELTHLLTSAGALERRVRVIFQPSSGSYTSICVVPGTQHIDPAPCFNPPGSKNASIERTLHILGQCTDPVSFSQLVEVEPRRLIGIILGEHMLPLDQLDSLARSMDDALSEGDTDKYSRLIAKLQIAVSSSRTNR